MEKQFEVVACSFPGCGCRGLAEKFYVPSRDAVAKANNGAMPKAADLATFAVCDRHAGVIRRDGVACYPLVAARHAVENDEARELAARQAKERWQEVQRRAKAAAVFQPKGIKPSDKVGNGLSRFSRHSAPAAHVVH